MPRKNFYIVFLILASMSRVLFFPEQAVADPSRCGSLLAWLNPWGRTSAPTGRKARTARAFRPSVEAMETRTPLDADTGYDATDLGNVPDGALVQLMNQLVTVVPGAQAMPSSGLDVLYINGVWFAQLSNGNVVPGGDVPEGPNGSFLNIYADIPGLPNTIPAGGITEAQAIADTTPHHVITTGRAIRRTRPLRRPPDLLPMEIKFPSLQRKAAEALAHAHQAFLALPIEQKIFLPLKEVEKRLGNREYTIERFYHAEMPARASMAASLLRHHRYLGAEIFTVFRDLGPPTSFFLEDHVPAYLLSDKPGDRWHLIFLPDERGERVDAVGILKVPEPPSH